MILYIFIIVSLLVIVGLLLAILIHDSSHPPKVMSRLIAESEARLRQEMRESQQHLIEVVARDLNTISDRCSGNGHIDEPVGAASPTAPATIQAEARPADSTTSTKHKKNWIDRISENHTGKNESHGPHTSSGGEQ